MSAADKAQLAAMSVSVMRKHPGFAQMGPSIAFLRQAFVDGGGIRHGHVPQLR